MADWVWYKLAVTVLRCLHDKAPKYLTAEHSGLLRYLGIAGRKQLYAQHTVTSWLYRAIVAIHWDGGCSPLLDQLFETRFPKTP